jgi:hypothetical protein
MKRTIIILACVILVVSMLLAACGKKDGDNNTTTTTKEQETLDIEIFTEPDTGESYVTNKNGEHIPVTTGKDGAVELIDDLITKTAKQVEEEKATSDQANQNQNNNNNGNSQTSESQTSQSEKTTGSQAEGDVEIGSGDALDEEHAAVIDWT